MQAMLGFLEATTLRPAGLGPEDAEAVRAAGVSDEAMVDALLVAAYFNLIDRLADSFAFTPISHVIGRDGLMRREAEFLERGYV